MGVCTRCGQEDAYTMAGRKLCADCCDRARIVNNRYRITDKGRETQRRCEARKVARRREEGLCIRCGKRKAKAASCLCHYCTAKAAERAREKRMASSANWPRGSNGYCYTCNKRPAASGRKICETCYGVLMASKRKPAEDHPFRLADLAMRRHGKWRETCATGEKT